MIIKSSSPAPLIAPGYLKETFFVFFNIFDTVSFLRMLINQSFMTTMTGHCHKCKKFPSLKIANSVPFFYNVRQQNRSSNHSYFSAKTLSINDFFLLYKRLSFFLLLKRVSTLICNNYPWLLHHNHQYIDRMHSFVSIMRSHQWTIHRI